MKEKSTIMYASAFTIIAIALGYIALGLLPAFIFTFGYLGGLIIWLLVDAKVKLQSVIWPFLLTLAFFVAHKVEEREMDFFPALSEITGVPVPESTSIPAIMLYAIALVWLAIPILIKLQKDFGYYLAWTFFASMGITELAHFVLPLFTDRAYGYFPGMASVVVLAPAAWWGMLQLSGRY